MSQRLVQPITPRRKRSNLGLLTRGAAREKNFILFLSGQTISRIGNEIYTVSLAWVVYALTGSTVAMRTVLTVNALPELALMLFGGAIADRIPRKTVILAADSISAIVLAVLAWACLSHALSMAMLLVSSFLLGATAAFYGPAYSAMNRDLLGDDKIHAANTVTTVCRNAARLTGPALAGVVYSFGGAGLAFALDGITFLVSVAAMLLIRTPPARRVSKQDRLAQELTVGLKYTARVAWLRVILVLSLIANAGCLAPIQVLLPALAPALVLLSGLIGAGTMLLGLLSGAGPVLYIGISLVGLGLSFDVIENTLMQRLVPRSLLSRV